MTHCPAADDEEAEGKGDIFGIKIHAGFEACDAEGKGDGVAGLVGRVAEEVWEGCSVFEAGSKADGKQLTLKEEVYTDWGVDPEAENLVVFLFG